MPSLSSSPPPPPSENKWNNTNKIKENLHQISITNSLNQNIQQLSILISKDTSHAHYQANQTPIS